MEVICFSDIYWDFLWQRHQQLLTRLPKHWKILYIEPSFLGTLVKHPRNSIPRHVSDTITVLSFPTFPLFDRNSLLRKINSGLIVFWTLFFMKLFRIKNPLVIIYEPRFSCVIGRIREFLSCYEIADDRLEFSQVPRWIENNIDMLIKNVDIVTVSASNLYKKAFEKRKKDLFLIGNGVDVDHFRKVREDIELPHDIVNVKKPVLGYFGAIGDWFDFTLVEKILKLCPELSVVLIGPVFPEQEDIVRTLEIRYSNIHVLGKKPYSVLPYYIKAFDVCLIPFKINELTRGVNPNKFYEYASAGKPVVTTDLPELYKYRDIIFLANDHMQFISLINESLHSKTEVNSLLRVAETNTWDSKAEEFIRIITQYASKKERSNE